MPIIQFTYAWGVAVRNEVGQGAVTHFRSPQLVKLKIIRSE